jgi:hypothetical protein
MTGMDLEYVYSATQNDGRIDRMKRWATNAAGGPVSLHSFGVTEMAQCNARKQLTSTTGNVGGLSARWSPYVAATLLAWPSFQVEADGAP